MSDYVEKDDVTPSIYQYQESDHGELVEALIPRACAIFDKLCDAPRGFFAKNQGASATEMIVYGNGMTFLPLPAYSALEGIAFPTGYAVPTYQELGGQLRITDAGGRLQAVTDPLGASVWPSGLPITVKAKWGNASTPEDVKQACIELTIAMFNDKDQKFLKAIQMDNSLIINEAIPRRVKIIASKYRNSFDGPAFV